MQIFGGSGVTSILPFALTGGLVNGIGTLLVMPVELHEAQAIAAAAMMKMLHFIELN